MQKNTAAVTPETVPSITYQSTPVVTTSRLAALYGTAKTNIQANHHNHRARFIEGTHMFFLKGNELKTFKNECKDIALVDIGGKRVNQLILWTERGAARHAKMLDTDQAWDVFEKLEECYFNRNKQPVTCEQSRLTPAQQHELRMAVAHKAYEAKDHLSEAFSTIYGEMKKVFKVASYKDIAQDRFSEAMNFVHTFDTGVIHTRNDDDVDHALVELIKRCPRAKRGGIATLAAAIALGIYHEFTISFPEAYGNTKAITERGSLE